jgi:hypothetical protein
MVAAPLSVGAAVERPFFAEKEDGVLFFFFVFLPL